MISPFIYGNIVSGRAFTNRKEEKEKLFSNMVNGVNTVIISPRRWGKSSLVEKVFKEIPKKHKNIKTIIIDLFTVSCEEEFLELFANEIIKASSSVWQDWVRSGKEFFKRIIPKISFGIDPYSDFTVSFDWNELRKNKNEILNLPETIAKKRKIKFVIGLDEFQILSTFKNYRQLEQNMRAVWQRQKNVTYCLYGSKRNMMTVIFDNPSNPFYRFGDLMFLKKIKRKEWINFIRKGFEKSDKVIDVKIAELIPRIMKDNSWYVQQLAHYTWNLTEKKATKGIVKKALQEVVSANTPLYEKIIEGLSHTQINLLKAIIQNEIQLTSVMVMQKYNLGTPHNVSKNKEILIKKEIIDKEGDKFIFLDPVFEIWFNLKFNNYSLDGILAAEFD